MDKQHMPSYPPTPRGVLRLNMDQRKIIMVAAENTLKVG